MAEDAIAKSDLDTAAALAQSLTARAPSSPAAYNVLGRVKALLGEPKQARKAFERGLKLAPEDPVLVYNMGCVEALQGDRIAALTSLERAFTLRPSLTKTAETDTDLASLAQDPEFKRLLTREYVIPAPSNVGGNSFSVN